jgi:hypothetical protein
MGQLDNAVMRIIVHLGDRKDETDNRGLTYTTATPTLGEAGRKNTIPIYFIFILYSTIIVVVVSELISS